MKYRSMLYGSLIIISIISILSVWFLPVNEVLRTISGLPFVGALFVALFQILRDHSSFAKEIFLQEREHAFKVAATSHMSQVLFDKHVEFSEAYIKELQMILGDLFAEGPKKSNEYVQSLYTVRRKYRLWISTDMALTLNDFEGKLIKMGASYGLWTGTKYQPGSDKSLDAAYEIFNEIIGQKENGIENSEIEMKKQKGYYYVIERLQEIIGIDQLTQLRDSVIRDSFNN